LTGPLRGRVTEITRRFALLFPHYNAKQYAVQQAFDL
jgi:hypothetical protein